MKQQLILNPDIADFLDIFKENFHKIYRHFDRSHKQRLLHYTPVLFKRWCYSTLYDETILSPANVIGALYGNNTVVGVSIHLPEDSKTITTATFSLELYTENKHPIIADLQCLLNFCQPSAELDQNGQLINKCIRTKLSLEDPFYLDFLMKVAYQLMLLEKLPSIYTSQIQMTSYAKAFFQQDHNVCLHKIIDTAIAICADQLSRTFYSLKLQVTKEMILHYLTDIEQMDDIFEKIYTKIGIDPEKIWKLSQLDTLTDTDSFLLSTTFYLGILLDRWFISPFGSYLKLIQPLYFNAFDFVEEMNHLCSNYSTSYDPVVDLFYPCTYYHLTSLGIQLLCPYKQLAEFQQLPNIPDIPNLAAAIRSKIALEEADSKKNKLLFPEEQILTCKIKYQNNKRFWKILEIQDNCSLDTLSTEINLAFSFDHDYNYSFSFDHAGEFVSDQLKGFQKASKATLKQLHLNEGQIFTYETEFNPSFKLEIEITKISQKKSGILYPRILKQSKWITEEESENI